MSARKITGEKIESVVRVSAKSLSKGTGRDWSEWRSLLDKSGAPLWERREIVAFLAEKHRLSPWWRQVVASGYEVLIGRRIEGRNQKGEYALSASKTMKGSRTAVWKLLSSPAGAAVWLAPMSDFKLRKGFVYEREDGVFGEVRTLKAPERFRLTWQDTDWEKASVVQMMLLPRPNGKCVLVFDHQKLREARSRDRLRAYWRDVLNQLAALSE